MKQDRFRSSNAKIQIGLGVATLKYTSAPTTLEH